MPYTMKTVYLLGLLWLYLLGFVYVVLCVEPGYLDFDNLPDTNFSCVGKVIGGYYADLETNCQMFHVCTIGQLDEPMDIRFLCLNGTVFDQETRVCERIDEVDCSKSEKFYSLNLELYGNTQPSISEDNADTDPPIIIKASTTTTTTTTTTTPKPKTKTTKAAFFTTAAPTVTTVTKVISAHHFPISNSPDIRFNPEEINISLHPGTLANLRSKSLAYQQQVFNDNKKKVVVTTHTSYGTPDKEDFVRIVPNTQRPVSSTQKIKGQSPATPADINYGFTYHQTEDNSQEYTEPPHNYQYHHSNVPYRHAQFRNQFKTTTYRSEHLATTRKHPYNPHKESTTFRTSYVSSLKTPTYHTYRTEKPQRLQLPLPLLPTLPPLTFSSPAPFSLGHHIETKRYTSDQPPPRIIISASASVSDNSGRRLNYSLGTIGVTPLLEEPPKSYDDYKDHDVVLDPFYHDVPKIKASRRKKRQIKPSDIPNEQAAADVLKFLFEWYSTHQKSSTVKVPINPEDITEINEQLAPIVEAPILNQNKSYDDFFNFKESALFKRRSKFNIVGDVLSVTEAPVASTSKPTVVTVAKLDTVDYVDDNYEAVQSNNTNVTEKTKTNVTTTEKVVTTTIEETTLPPTTTTAEPTTTNRIMGIMRKRAKTHHKRLINENRQRYIASLNALKPKIRLKDKQKPTTEAHVVEETITVAPPAKKFRPSSTKRTTRTKKITTPSTTSTRKVTTPSTTTTQKVTTPSTTTTQKVTTPSTTTTQKITTTITTTLATTTPEVTTPEQEIFTETEENLETETTLIPEENKTEPVDATEEPQQEVVDVSEEPTSTQTDSYDDKDFEDDQMRQESKVSSNFEGTTTEFEELVAQNETNTEDAHIEKTPEEPFDIEYEELEPESEKTTTVVENPEVETTTQMEEPHVTDVEKDNLLSKPRIRGRSNSKFYDNYSSDSTRQATAIKTEQPVVETTEELGNEDETTDENLGTTATQEMIEDHEKNEDAGHEEEVLSKPDDVEYYDEYELETESTGDNEEENVKLPGEVTEQLEISPKDKSSTEVSEDPDDEDNPNDEALMSTTVEFTDTEEHSEHLENKETVLIKPSDVNFDKEFGDQQEEPELVDTDKEEEIKKPRERGRGRGRTRFNNNYKTEDESPTLPINDEISEKDVEPKNENEEIIDETTTENGEIISTEPEDADSKSTTLEAAPTTTPQSTMEPTDKIEEDPLTTTPSSTTLEEIPSTSSTSTTEYYEETTTVDANNEVYQTIATESSSTISTESATNLTPAATTTTEVPSTTRSRHNARRTRPLRTRTSSSYRRPNSRHRFSTELTSRPSRRKPVIEDEIVDALTSQLTTTESLIKEEISTSPRITTSTIVDYTEDVPATDAPLFKSANPTQAESAKESLHTTPLSMVYKLHVRKEKLKSYIFNCFGKAINKFYSDPRDCRLFHYCTSGYTKNQLLDMKFVCDLGTYFDEEKLICTKSKPERCL
ncbi:hypothetical protein Zmor_025883 [Zophobas morio]|uniref:Chitin-binding type-2 domain-containing protein n=1 Tax=Zophobas morio TaxID=2755281 RepID=A0AA38HTD6_9CUCU|nr:hypothetical protein Zmor_025883 [Zophobas morio]